MGSSDLGPTINEAVVELPEKRKDFLSIHLLRKREKSMEREGSTPLQNANEAEVILLYIQLNVLKGLSRDDYPNLFSENTTETLLHGAHNTIYLHTGRLTHGYMPTVKEFPLREEW